jgi:ribosomal-protein-alanine N-acetyltransferase
MRLDTPLKTARIELRTLAPEDAEGVYHDWLQDPEILKFLESRSNTHTQAGIEDHINSMNESDTELLLGIFLKSSNRHIGNIKLGGVNQCHRRAAIGLLIGEKSQWGKGYATEAIEAIVSYADSILDLHRVYAACHANNPSSYKAFVKAGFEEEGRFRSHDLIGEEWVDSIMYGRLLS